MAQQVKTFAAKPDESVTLFLMIGLLLEIRGFPYSQKLNLKPLLTRTGRE